MSVVTNVILSFSVMESDLVDSDDSDVIQRVNKFFEPLTQKFVVPDNHDWYGGSKHLETPLFIGAFNYLQLDEFTKWLRVLPWKYPEAVQLLVKREDDEKFWDVEVFK